MNILVLLAALSAPSMAADGKAAVPAAAGSDHHVHEAPEFPSAAEECVCGSSSVKKTGCVLEDADGACVLDGEFGGRCMSWHCHPGAADAHKAPWKPGKPIALKPLPAEKRVAPPGSDACKPAARPGDFPYPLHGPTPGNLTHCQEWAGQGRVDYPEADGKADCTRPIPILVTRCTATLDPSLTLSRTDVKDADCRCGEWTATARPTGAGESEVAQTSTCTAYLCRLKRKG